MEPIAIHSFVQGPGFESTRQELRSPYALPVSYAVSFPKSLIGRIVSRVAKTCLFPLQRIAAHFILPGPRTNYWLKRRPELLDLGSVRRFTIEVEGSLIDVCTVQEHPTDRWVLASCPNMGSYEGLLLGRGNFSGIESIPVQLANQLGANIIAFNYPGVGASTGSPNPEIIGKAYKAVLAILEQELGAHEIVHYGWSMGGGAQALGLKDWQFNPSIQHVCIKDRTFSTLGGVVQQVLGEKFLGWMGKILIRAIGWEIDTKEASRSLSCPEIILQTGWDACSSRECVPMHSSEGITDDGLFLPHTTLAKALVDRTHAGEKYYFLTGAGHSGSDINVARIAEQVNAIFQEKKAAA